MAAEVTTMPTMNGSYAPQAYAGMDAQQGNNGAYNHNGQAAYGQAPPTSSTPTTTASSQPEIPKDEVGWYFVEQYYTTLSRSPEKLYLFYNKRSQFVSGQETDKVAVCVGQRAINDKIKDMDFSDCKVRVTNVDSQASDNNIVIQVIGEISNKSQPHKKFTQTFVLATQTNGYFVLNDIFRYLIEEEDEAETEAATQKEEVQQTSAAEASVKEAAPAAEVAETKTLTSSSNPAAIEHDAELVDRELKKTASEETAEAKPAQVNGESKKEETKATKTDSKPEAALPKQPAAALSEKPEKPVEPVHTPASNPTPKAAPAQPAPAPKPSVPKTWASLAASATSGVALPAAPTSTAPSTTSQTRAAPAAKAAAAAAAAPAPAVPTAAPAASSTPAAQSDDSSNQQDEWTAVGGSHNRQQSKANTQQQEGPQTRAYIKNVQDNIDEKDLKALLEKFGEVAYIDVARQKNCAFIDFKDASGYQAAVAANPHIVGTTKLWVEERRLRPGQAPMAQRGQFQGGRTGGRGGANQGQARNNSQGGNRNAPARGGRNGAPASKPRGGSSQAQ